MELGMVYQIYSELRYNVWGVEDFSTQCVELFYIY